MLYHQLSLGSFEKAREAGKLSGKQIWHDMIWRDVLQQLVSFSPERRSLLKVWCELICWTNALFVSLQWHLNILRKKLRGIELSYSLDPSLIRASWNKYTQFLLPGHANRQKELHLHKEIEICSSEKWNLNAIHLWFITFIQAFFQGKSSEPCFRTSHLLNTHCVKSSFWWLFGLLNSCWWWRLDRYEMTVPTQFSWLVDVCRTYQNHNDQNKT